MRSGLACCEVRGNVRDCWTFMEELKGGSRVEVTVARHYLACCNGTSVAIRHSRNILKEKVTLRLARL